MKIAIKPQLAQRENFYEKQIVMSFFVHNSQKLYKYTRKNVHLGTLKVIASISKTTIMTMMVIAMAVMIIVCKYLFL